MRSHLSPRGSAASIRIIRLVGAVLCEIHDDWAMVRRYMTINREEKQAELKALAPKRNAA